MLRRLLLLICFAGIAVYSVKIYQLKDRVSFQPSGSTQNSSLVQKASLLRLNFYIESDNADLLQRCQNLFTQSTDKITMDAHASNPKLAILHVIRDFAPEKLPEVVQLQTKAKEAGCLTGDRNTFVYAPLK